MRVPAVRAVRLFPIVHGPLLKSSDSVMSGWRRQAAGPKMNSFDSTDVQQALAPAVHTAPRGATAAEADVRLPSRRPACLDLSAEELPARREAAGSRGRGAGFVLPWPFEKHSESEIVRLDLQEIQHQPPESKHLHFKLGQGLVPFVKLRRPSTHGHKAPALRHTDTPWKPSCKP